MLFVPFESTRFGYCLFGRFISNQCKRGQLLQAVYAPVMGYSCIFACISRFVVCRCVSIFPDQKGFAVGSIEGRVGIEYFSEQAAKAQTPGGYKPVNTYGGAKLSFAFKCHRVTVSSRLICDGLALSLIYFCIRTKCYDWYQRYNTILGAAPLTSTRLDLGRQT